MQRKDKKFILIGIDGLDPKLLYFYLKEYSEFTNFKYFAKNGIYGYNKVFLPPLSPAIWTSLATGLTPFQHKVLDFIDIKIVSNKIRLNIKSSYILKGKAIWDFLGQKNYYSIIVNYPFTYPPYKIKGIMVSGFPSPKRGITVFPQQLESRLKTIAKNYKTEFFPSKVENIISEAIKSIEKRVKLFSYITSNYTWDFSSLVITEIDRVQHLLYEPKYFNTKIYNLYLALDKYLGTILDIANENNANILLLSDHGFETLKYYISLPKLLEEFNIPYVRSLFQEILRYKSVQRFAINLMNIKLFEYIGYFLLKIFFSKQSLSGHDIVIENNYCLKNINRNDIEKYLELLTNYTYRGFNIFEKIFTSESYIKYILDEIGKCYLYPFIKIWKKGLPDIIIVPKTSFEMTINKLRNVVVESKDKRGSHYSISSSRGVFMALGKSVRPLVSNNLVEVNVIDIAPTLLKFFGLNPHKAMLGNIRYDLFYL